MLFETPVFGKILKIMDGRILGEITFLYVLVANRYAAEVVIGARSLYSHCPAYSSCSKLRIFFSSRLFMQIQGSICLLASSA